MLSGDSATGRWPGAGRHRVARANTGPGEMRQPPFQVRSPPDAAKPAAESLDTPYGLRDDPCARRLGVNGRAFGILMIMSGTGVHLVASCSSSASC